MVSHSPAGGALGDQEVVRLRLKFNNYINALPGPPIIITFVYFRQTEALICCKKYIFSSNCEILLLLLLLI